jgi:NAD-dependent dihydropyrimidine dehydrogenase PreA subunit
MIDIDEASCTGCGECIAACPQKAIIRDGSRMIIKQNLCTSCGNCISVCSSGAIHEVVTFSRKIKKGGERMYYGYGRGFGFRGSSPPWPYTGRGRGGLPRCWYPGMGRAAFPGVAATSYWSAPVREDELGILRSQAEATRRQLEDIEQRIRELEKKE